MDKSLNNLKVAITHDYLIDAGGAERVLIELLKMFPNADLFTSVFWKEQFDKEFLAEISKHKVYMSFATKLKILKKQWKLFLPFHSRFFQKLNLTNYDIVISNSSSFSKWLNLSSNIKHIAYINTPPRFIWGMETTIYHKIPSILKKIIDIQIKKWKKKDFYYAQNVDLIIANSKNIQSKIKTFYNRDSIIIYPPVNTTLSNRIDSKSIQDEFYLVVNRLVAYKHIDKVILAFNNLNKKLIIVGDGPEKEHLHSIAKNNIKFTGFVDDTSKNMYLSQCKALIYAGEEDFGIGMIEAHAYGKPVIAFNKGGAKEIINENNGVLFDFNEPQSIFDAVEKLEKIKFDEEKIKNSAARYNQETFKKNVYEAINSVL